MVVSGARASLRSAAATSELQKPSSFRMTRPLVPAVALSGSLDGHREFTVWGRSREGMRSGCMGPRSWPGWARGLVTLGLLYHMAAVVAGAMGVPPSSELERHIADLFTPYHDLLDQGYAYRYYAEPPPTPVITATAPVRRGTARPGRPAARNGILPVPG